MAGDRFVNNTLSELEKANHSPIFGYEDSPMLTLEEAVEKIIPLVSHVMDYVATAKKKYNRHSDLLTRDESAAIYLYSMSTPFFSCLNETLRAENRHALKPWFAFLKLFITALEKLPSTKNIVWRGVSGDVGSIFADNNVHIWWSINSCSLDPSIIQSYLDDNGTLFAIHTIHGKDISAFSAISDEREVLLMPGTRLRAKCESLSFNDHLFILHFEEINPQSESQSESNYLFEYVKQTYRQNNRIERIMNPAKSFPIEQSYINLAIVKAKDQYEKEKQLGNAGHNNDIMGSFEEIYGMKTAIDVKNIFDTCKNEEKQVLVFGRAGIGKSTFCRYIAYQWATGSYWSQYKLLALIPLRRLTLNRYPLLPPGQNYSLINFIKKEVFPYDLSEKDERLLKNEFDAKKTLWILDGYDEIIQNVPPHLECLFEQLLKTPHHILTSRPYSNALSYNVQMEITGFTDENIEEYMQQFFNQMKDELDNATIKSQTLLKFLKSNRSIWGVAHIPVNLELICSLWSNEDWSETTHLTITTLYSMMIECLCRRYLRTQDNQILQLSEDEIDQCCQKELAFLASLAFNAMENNTIIIRPSSLKKALKEAQVSLKEHPHILNIGILKSFNKQGIGNQIQMNKDHYFVHLSFQEYFAARYLTSALKGCSPEKAIEFIKHQKYNQRYALVFSFASGILSKNDTEFGIYIFWNTILGEPLDLVGLRHIQLVISCFEATSDKSTLPRRTQLLQWIGNCIQYNVSNGNEIILKHLSQSLERAQSVLCDPTILNVLINLLQCNETDTKVKVFSFLSELEISNPSIALINSIVTTLTDKNDKVRVSACEALGMMGEKAATNEMISRLVSALGDQSEYVRSKASCALGHMGEKAATNEVISKLINALGDESEDVRWSACEALGMMGEKAGTNEVIGKLVIALGHEREYVRASACEALGKMGKKAGTNEVIAKLVSALGDESRDVRWSACEALGRMGEKAGTNEVIDKLVIALGHEREYVRASACEALGKMGAKAGTNEVIDKLVSALGDENREVRWSACKALGMMGEKAATNEVIGKLVSALGDENREVRVSACEALGMMGEKAATNEMISRLVSALGDQSEDVRSKASCALGHMGEKAATNEVISKLINALRDESEDVRRSACVALGDMGEKATTNEVISNLVSALEDKSRYVRMNACYALGRMGEKAATNEVISNLVSALEHESRYIRMNACYALGRMGEKAATNEVISKLVSGLEDESEDVRMNACDALGNMSEKVATNEVISKLVSALGDESEGVRMNAGDALGTMGKEAATNEMISRLVSALGDENVYVRGGACEALGKMGEKAATNDVISKLVSALGDASHYVIRSACYALGKMGEKVATNEVISKLTSISNSDDSGSFYTAANAVENILSSSAVITQLDPNIISYFCLSKNGSISLKNVSVDELMNVFLATKNPDWLPVLIQFTILEGAAVTVTGDKVIVYGSKESSNLLVPSSRLRHQLIKAFTDQAKRLHLYFEVLFKDEVKLKGTKSEDIGKLRLNEDDKTTSTVQLSTHSTSQTSFENTDENQNIIILCFGVELSDKNIPPTYQITSFDNPFKFIANTLSVKDKTIYVIVSTNKSHSVIPIIHKHYCVEKIYLYRTSDTEFSFNLSSMSEKISGYSGDLNELYDQIVNDIKKTAERPLRWNRSFNIFTMLHTQRLENEYSIIKELAGMVRDEYIVSFHCHDGKYFHPNQGSTPTIELTDATEFLQLINEKIQSQIFLVISGSMIPLEIQSIFDSRQIHAIYFFCNNELKYPVNKRKVSGIFDKDDELSDQLRKDILFYRQQHIHTSRIDIFSMIEHTGNVISQLNDKQIAFLIYNLFIDILPQVPLLEFKLEDLIKICNTLFPNEGEETAYYVHQLHEENNEVKNFIQDPKFSQIVLRLHHLDKLNEMFILQKTFINIQEVFQSIKISTTDTVYVTKLISNDTLKKIVKSNSGEFISIGIFTVAIKSLRIARKMARKMTNNGLISVLFQIDVAEDTRLLEIDFDRVIFSLGSVFRLESINQAIDAVWYVKVKSADSGFRSIKEQIQCETEVPLSWLCYGNYLYFLKQSQQAKAYFEFLLEKLPSEHTDRPSIYSNMIWIYTMENGKGGNTEAEKKYNDTLKTKPSIDRSTVLASIADVHYRKGDYKLALDHYKQALELSTDSHCRSYYQQMIETVENII